MPERLKGEVARFDITTPDGTIVVAKTSASLPSVRDLQNSKVERLGLPTEEVLVVSSRPMLSTRKPARFWSRLTRS